MLSLIKFLKIVLPVATVTSATIATVSLVSFQKLDNKLDREAEDRVLEDFEVLAEQFEEQEMLYAKDGQGNNVAVKDEKQKQHLLEELAKNNGRLEQSDQAFDTLKDRGSNNPSKGPQVENKDKEASERPDLKNESPDGDQPNQEDQVSSQPFLKQPSELMKEPVTENIISQKPEAEKDLTTDEPKKEEEDVTSKPATVKGDKDSSKSLASSEGEAGDENSKNCDPCPKGDNSKDLASIDEKSKGLGEKSEEDKKEMSQTTVKTPEVDPENSDVSGQTNDGIAPTSELGNHEAGGSNGILNEEASNSSLTSPEQLEALNGLYGQVTDVLSQLQSKFSL